VTDNWFPTAALNGTEICEWWVVKDAVGTSHDLFLNHYHTMAQMDWVKWQQTSIQLASSSRFGPRTQNSGNNSIATFGWNAESESVFYFQWIFINKLLYIINLILLSSSVSPFLPLFIKHQTSYTNLWHDRNMHMSVQKYRYICSIYYNTQT
jgi:hypothetical protein